MAVNSMMMQSMLFRPENSNKAQLDVQKIEKSGNNLALDKDSSLVETPKSQSQTGHSKLFAQLFEKGSNKLAEDVSLINVANAQSSTSFQKRLFTDSVVVKTDSQGQGAGEVQADSGAATGDAQNRLLKESMSLFSQTMKQASSLGA